MGDPLFGDQDGQRDRECSLTESFVYQQPVTGRLRTQSAMARGGNTATQVSEDVLRAGTHTVQQDISAFRLAEPRRDVHGP